MAFNYTPLTETQKLKDMYPKVNDIGNFLKTEVNLSDLKVISGVDFNNILDKIPDSGNYYVTTSKNQPPGANWNGFVRLDKRDKSYYKIYYSPFNSNKMYIKTYANGTVYDWISFKLDEGNLYNEGNTLNVKELTESTTQYATLINPPKENLNTGWVNYKESKNGVSSLVEFNPVNSTSTFKMIRKLPVQEQNPNLIKDSLFNQNVQLYTEETVDKNWSSQKTGIDTGITYNTGVKFKGQDTVSISNTSIYSHPLLRSNYLEVGKDVNEGDTVTFSAYVMVDNVDNMKGNWVYIQLARYDSISLDTNSQIGEATTVNGTNAVEIIKPGEWVRITNTQTVPSGVKYITANLRGNLTRSDVDSSWTAYFALPKLELGDKNTPFITNTSDSIQFDEIWSNWLENPDEQSILNNYTTDINKDNYFKYAWFENDVNGMSLKELIMTVPQGYHTFYCQGSIDGTPKNRSIRGTIQVDYDKGDPNTTNKFINVHFTDNEGIPYTLYFGGYNQGWKILKQSETSTLLWEGTLDFGSTESVNLNDSVDNYDLIEITYWTRSAGHFSTKRLDLKNTSNLLYIRDFNMANDSTGSSVDFFEGYCTLPTRTSVQPGMVKSIALDGSTNTTKVASWNEKERIKIYTIMGINRG